MPNVTVQKVRNPASKPLPIFEEMEELLNQARIRAYEMFQNRGREIGRALDDWLTAEKETFGCPPSEVTEKPAMFDIRVALPGYEAGDVQVTAAPGEILVRAKSTRESHAEDEETLWSEFGQKDAYRRFELPQPVDVDQVAAQLDQGILRITAAKAAMPKKKEIAVATAA